MRKKAPRRPATRRLAGAGILLVALSWPATWLLPGAHSHLLFFPLWLGYILVVDAVCLHRRAGSLLLASPRRFALLFVASAPVWWLFEAVNLRLENWVYVGREAIGSLEYFVTASIAFSTVIPAVFVTARLIRSFAWVERFADGPRIDTGPLTLGLWPALGGAMMALLLLWPRYFFALTWLALIFLVEPLAWMLRRRCLLAHWRVGDWRPAVSLALGALVCGFFWELWNYWACPKWIYQVPFVDFGRIFEMPVLGYGGYLPFGLELYPLTHLLLPPSRTPSLWPEADRG